LVVPRPDGRDLWLELSDVQPALRACLAPAGNGGRTLLVDATPLSGPGPADAEAVVGTPLIDRSGGWRITLVSGERLGGAVSGLVRIEHLVADDNRPPRLALDAGSLRVAGEIGSLIDPAAGMDPLLTGRENVVLRALYRGMTEAAGRALADEVQGFAGLGEFLDVPIRGYSAGMNVRLSFAMATAMTPEILLMDEWFLAGDADFMARADKRLSKLVTDAEILMIATHDMAIVRRWCTRAIRLEGGRILADGPVADVLAAAGL
jgi:hypothetical protein